MKYEIIANDIVKPTVCEIFSFLLHNRVRRGGTSSPLRSDGSVHCVTESRSAFPLSRQFVPLRDERRLMMLAVGTPTR
jgi:hypothetical protein